MAAAKSWVMLLGALVVAAILAPAAQTPSPARLLVLLKGGPPDATWAGGGALAIVDPVTGKEVGRVPTGENAHEVTTSADGRLAFLTAGVINGTDKGRRRFIYVIDVAAQKELRCVDIGPLSNPHGIQFAGGKVYFTAEGYNRNWNGRAAECWRTRAGVCRLRCLRGSRTPPISVVVRLDGWWCLALAGPGAPSTQVRFEIKRPAGFQRAARVAMWVRSPSVRM